MIYTYTYCANPTQETCPAAVRDDADYTAPTRQYELLINESYRPEINLP